MIEIEASQICVGGGKILLYDLLKYLHAKKITAIVWIANDTIRNEVFQNYGDFFDLRRTSIFRTLFRYMKKRSSVLFFCSIPPMTFCPNSLTYFQNMHYVADAKEFKEYVKNGNYKKIFKYYFFHLWIRLFKHKSPCWGCQTPNVQESLKDRFGIKAELLPFCYLPKCMVKERIFDFCYIAYPYPHKNHLRLLKAIDSLSAKYVFNVILTIPEQGFPEITKTIEKINTTHGRRIIINVGIQNRDVIFDYYSQTKFLIFPSLTETLGLPLIEANHFGVKVLSSDLPFSHASIANIITFDSLNVRAIYHIMEQALLGNFNEVKQSCLVPNSIDNIVDYLQEAN